MDKNVPLTEALFYILLSLRKPNHGYGIIQEVEQLTGGRVVLGPGTLYGAIQTMMAKGWIRIFSEETDSRRKKEYGDGRQGLCGGEKAAGGASEECSADGGRDGEVYWWLSFGYM